MGSLSKTSWWGGFFTRISIKLMTLLLSVCSIMQRSLRHPFPRRVKVLLARAWQESLAYSFSMNLLPVSTKQPEIYRILLKLKKYDDYDGDA
jgi:hypothetical protein